MRKKQASRRHKAGARKKHFLRFIFHKIFLGCIGVFLLFFTGALYFSHQASLPVCANSISCTHDLSGKISLDTQGIFMGNKVQAPDQTYFVQNTLLPDTNVLGASTPPAKKQIFVDLAEQRLYAFEGNKLIYDFQTSTGKWAPTPDGTFYIWIKLEATRMTGGDGPTFYDLPNVPWTMFFYNAQIPKSAGFSVHGAYWHSNFGYPMSHGCVNLRPYQAKLLYEWADPPATGYTTLASTENPGTEITIYGSPPANEVNY